MTRVFQFIIAIAILTGSTTAQTDTAFTYQGELRESGDPANGSYNIDFGLWDALSAGNQVGSSIEFNNLPVTDGLFTVELDFGAAAFDGSQLWLEIAVDGNELVPRQPLTGAPFALQMRGIVVDADNNVGIGTSSPACELEVANLTPGTGAEAAVTADDAAGAIAAYSSTIPPPFEHYAGRVSLFSNAATMGLDLRADAYVGDIRCYTGGFAVSNERLRITNTGYVGIGTSTPEHKLHITHNVADEQAIFAVHTSGDLATPAIGGIHAVTDGAGIGVIGKGGFIGVAGQVAPTGAEGYMGVYGYVSGGSGTNYGVYAEASGGSTNYGVYCVGRCAILGLLEKSGGSFKIDHPLDPANKYLYHSFVESPDMMNIYNGNVITDAAGYATIEMPEWFNALNADFRYQLTVIDDTDSDEFILAKVTRKMHKNQFTIRTSAPYVEISWQVTGVRIDAFAMEHRIPVEEYKPDNERGLYQFPELFGQPKELGINYVNGPGARVNK